MKSFIQIIVSWYKAANLRGINSEVWKRREPPAKRVRGNKTKKVTYPSWFKVANLRGTNSEKWVQALPAGGSQSRVDMLLSVQNFNPGESELRLASSAQAACCAVEKGKKLCGLDPSASFRVHSRQITAKPCISSIPQGIAYHQCKALYIIKPQKMHADA